MAFEEDEPAGAPEWIVTFSDMISLLVTFFVLLLSFASIATKDEPRMKQFLRGMWGVFPADEGSAVDLPEEPPTPDQTYRVNASMERSSRPFDDVLHELERGGLRSDDERLPIDLAASTTGIRLSFGSEETFAPGDDQPTAHLDRALVRIADVVRNYPFEIVIEGHSDSGFGSNARFGRPESLALARAAAAAEVMTRSGKLDSKRLALAGLAGPGVEADPTARAQSRRIELRLIPVKGM